MSEPTKLLEEYLGDGVYAIQESYGFRLCTNDHRHPDDTIYSEPDVFDALIRFALKAGFYVPKTTR